MHGWRLQQSTDKCRDPSPPKHALCSKRPISARNSPAQIGRLQQCADFCKAPRRQNMSLAANDRFLQEIVLPKLAACSNVPISARRHNAKTCPLQQMAGSGKESLFPHREDQCQMLQTAVLCRSVLHKGAVLAASRPLLGPFRGKNRDNVHFCAARTAGLTQTAGRAAHGKSEGGTLRALRPVGRPHPVSAREELWHAKGACAQAVGTPCEKSGDIVGPDR